MTNCVFCTVVETNGSHREVVWQNEKHFAFLDAMPVRPGHTLVIPRTHQESILDMGDAEYADYMADVRAVAVRIKAATGAKKIGFVISGFSVPHVHVHLLPLNSEGEMGNFTPSATTPEEMAEVAKLIRSQVI